MGNSCRSWVVAAMFALCAVLGCGPKGAPEGSTELTAQERQDLLVGYELLSNTLSDESKLGKLEIFKKLMLDAPNDAIGKIMGDLSDASKKRADELDAIRKRAPDITGKPAKASPVGDAINDIAKDFGKADMMSREGGFDVRFVLVQAQATRMVAAMATATARFEPNPDRKLWLRRLALEYEGYRGNLIKYLGGHAADTP